MMKRILVAVLAAMTGVLFLATSGLPHSGGGGGGTGAGGGGGSAGGSAMSSYTSTQASYNTVRAGIYTHYSQGIHDAASADQAFEDYKADRRDDDDVWSQGTLRDEQFDAILVSSVAWGSKHTQGTKRLAMVLEAMIQEGSIKPSQAMTMIGIYLVGIHRKK